MSREYNYIYRSLVEGKDDIVGHIAYALYKEDKIAYIEKFKKDNDNKDPDEADLKPFHDTTNAEGNLDRLKLMAVSILQEFTNGTLEETIKDIEKEVINKHKEHLSDIIQPIKPKGLGNSYFHSIIQSIAGAFIFMLLIAGIIFAVNLSSKGYTFTLGGNGNATINECAKQQTDTVDIKL